MSVEYSVTARFAKVDIQEIPPKYQDVFELFQEEGHQTLEEISRTIDINRADESIRWLKKQGLIASLQSAGGNGFGSKIRNAILGRPGQLR